MEGASYSDLAAARIDNPKRLNSRGNVFKGEVRNGSNRIPIVVKYLPYTEDVLLELSFLRKYCTGDSRIGPLFYGFNQLGTTLEVLMEAAEEQIEATVPFTFSATHQKLYDIGKAAQKIEEDENVHGDLKPANILTIKDKVVVIDYGNMLPKAMYQRVLKNRKIHGTHGYIPPEQYVKTPGYIPTRHDSFSLGMVMFYLATQTSPQVILSGFAKRGRIDLTRVIGEGHYHIEFTRALHEQRNVPDRFKRLVRDAICYNPFERPSIVEINQRLQEL